MAGGGGGEQCTGAIIRVVQNVLNEFWFKEFCKSNEILEIGIFLAVLSNRTKYQGVTEFHGSLSRLRCYCIIYGVQ